MSYTRLIAAICTPLREGELLHEDGLAAHIETQVAAGMDGMLVAGTMGLLQLLREETYRALVRHSVEFNRGRCELLVGVGDMSYARTLDRIRFAERFDVAGLVVLTPSFLPFSTAELENHFRSLADEAKKPIYLYDLPQRTGISLDHDMIDRLAEHPNVAGIKCSGDWDGTRRLIQRVGDRFRVVVAQPTRMAELIGQGVREHLDGVLSIFPRLSRAIADAAEREQHEKAERLQELLASALDVICKSVFPSCTVILNELGIPGSVAPAPMQTLSTEERAELLAQPAIIASMKEER